MTMPDLVNSRQLAELLGISKNTLRSYRQKGLLPNGTQYSVDILFDLDEVFEHVRRHNLAVSPEAIERMKLAQR